MFDFKGLFVISIFILSCCVLASDECPSYSLRCANKGSSCTGDFLQNATVCSLPGASCCEYPYYCLNSSCISDSEAFSCAADSDCVVQVYGTGLHVCLEGRCHMQFNVDDDCAKDSDCAGDMTCTSGRCRGLEQGHSCVLPLPAGSSRPPRPFVFGPTRFVCASGLACSPATLTCEPAAATGSACVNGTPCSIYDECVNGICVAAHSRGRDEPCVSDYVCKEGFVCNASAGVCTAAAAWRHVSCTQDSDCAAAGLGGTCSDCVQGAGTRFCSAEGAAGGCAAVENDALRCLRRNKCAPTIGKDVGLCGQRLCSQELNKVLGCSEACGQPHTRYGNCMDQAFLRYCPGLAAWKRTLIAFSVVIAVVLIVALIYAVSHICANMGYDEVGSL